MDLTTWAIICRLPGYASGGSSNWKQSQHSDVGCWCPKKWIIQDTKCLSPQKLINSLNIWWNSSDDYDSSVLGGYFYFGDFLKSTASWIQITHVIAYDNLIHGPFSLSTWPPLSFGNLWSIPLCCQITDIKLLPFSYVDAWKAFSTKDHLDIYHIIHGPYKTINIKN